MQGCLGSFHHADKTYKNEPCYTQSLLFIETQLIHAQSVGMQSHHSFDLWLWQIVDEWAVQVRSRTGKALWLHLILEFLQIILTGAYGYFL